MARHRAACARARRMIPEQNIVAWGNVVPWADQRQVEQDLIISRALVETFSDPMLRVALRIRGGNGAQQAALPGANALFGGYRPGPYLHGSDRPDSRSVTRGSGAMVGAGAVRSKPGRAEVSLRVASFAKLDLIVLDDYGLAKLNAKPPRPCSSSLRTDTLPDLPWLPVSSRSRNGMTGSVTLPSPTPFSTASSTTPTSSNSREDRCERRKLHLRYSRSMPRSSVPPVTANRLLYNRKQPRQRR